MKSSPRTFDLALFDWSIPESGYRWLGARRAKVHHPRPTVARREGPQLFLAQAKELERPSQQRLPLRDSPELFRTFADLDPANLPAVLAFANQHGWLGLEEAQENLMYAPDPQDRERKRRGDLLVRVEGLAEWARAIFVVRQAVDLLDAAEKQDEKRLRFWMPSLDDEWVTYRRSEGGPTRAVARQLARQWKEEGFQFDPEEFVRSHPKAVLTFNLETRIRIDSRSPIASQLRKGDWVGAGRIVAQRLINQGLDPHTRARLVYDPETKEFNRHIAPRNLLGAIWIQTAAMAEGGHSYGRCEQCRGWFVLSPEINRSDRTYCSDRCRHKAYRDRRQRARELHAKGMTSAKIARELASDTRTVRGWVGE